MNPPSVEWLCLVDCDNETPCSCVYFMRTSAWSSACYRVNEYLCGTSIKQKENEQC